MVEDAYIKLSRIGDGYCLTYACAAAYLYEICIYMLYGYIYLALENVMCLMCDLLRVSVYKS